MSPVAGSDGHDPPGQGHELVPGEAAVVEDVAVGLEDTIGEPVLAEELPDILGGVEFGRAGWDRQQGDVGWHGQLVGHVPAGLIEQDDGVGACGHGLGDPGQVQLHRRGGAAEQDQAGALSLLRADGAEDVGRAGALVVRRCGAGPASGPAPGDLVLLADPRLVLKPDLYRLARMARGDLRHAGREVFLNAAAAAGSWA